MDAPQPVFTSNGTPATQGVCPECGTKLFRMGRTPAHEGLDPEAGIDLSGKPKMVIVESPAKARTVGRFLGKGYIVKASVGHVRDLPSNRMGVDVERDFEPRYVIPVKRKDVVRELKADVKKSSEVYLATDPDREGEAISWHLVEALEKAIGRREVHRVEFHEITQDAIAHAFAHPREIDMQRVDAQQARRILDRLVGYTLSPLLREKMGRRGLSAGRVQSVAVRLVVEREREIEAFAPVEYWSIEAELAKQPSPSAPPASGSPPLSSPQAGGKKGGEETKSFLAKLHRIRGAEPELHSQADVQAVLAELEQAAYTVASVKEGQRRRNPAAPFTTSTLQQEASQRLGLTARRTMALAQQLYEGVDLGDGPTGLITYMRTDSVNVAEQAQAEARAFVIEAYGEDFAPAEPPTYKTRAKGAQEAHEAIRPTSVTRTPASLKEYLDRSQYRLYTLIWQRFVASQMAPAVYDTIAVEVAAGSPPSVPPPSGGEAIGSYVAHVFTPPVPPASGGEAPYLFRASGSSLRFKGFLAVYEEAKDEDGETEEEESKREEIPPLSVDEVLDLIRLLPEQHFTQPPPRYSEASLVRALEEYGIGRPSTYAPTMATIQQRGYVQRREGRLHPTEVGVVVNDLLVDHFPDYIDVGFTAQMEEDLDAIAAGEREWVPVLHAFYDPFSVTLEQAREEMPEVQMGNEPTGEDCPKCGQPLLTKYGRFGKFIGCSNFPECRYTRQIQAPTGIKCPECGGDVVEKHTRRGRTFYGCSNYDASDDTSCQFASWKRPLKQACPACGGLLVEARKEWAKCIKCEEEFALAEIESETEEA
ncbi:MAG: type I DNA topoisomerase [Anaerolineae bacterium]|nr:type I DNA topoisomerase [Anaerolineae bacterium]